MTDFSGARLLVVEDQAILALAHKALLEKVAYTVEVVLTGEAAIEKVREGVNFDLILMDINLGSGIDGTQAARHIIGEQDIPILFLSSHTEPEYVAKTEAITNYGYVVKSSSPTVLYASIKMALRLHRAKIQLRERNHLLQNLFNQSPIGIMAIDEKLYIVQANKVAEEFAQRTLAEVTPARCGDFLGCLNASQNPGLCGETPQCATCGLNLQIRGVLAGKGPQDLELGVLEQLTGVEVRHRTIRYKATPLPIEGRPGVLLTFYDLET